MRISGEQVAPRADVRHVGEADDRQQPAEPRLPAESAAGRGLGTAAMNRNATPKLKVLSPGVSMPMALRTPGAASAVMIAPMYSEPLPRVMAHWDQEREPDGEDHDRAEVAQRWEELLRQQQTAKDEQEDPHCTGPAGSTCRLVAPLPGVDLDVGLAGRAATTVRTEARDGDRGRRSSATAYRRPCRRRSRGVAMDRRPRSRRRSIAGHDACPDGARALSRPRSSGSPCRTSTRRSRCGKSFRAGITGTDPRRAGNPRGARRFGSAGGPPLVDLTAPGSAATRTGSPGWARTPG